MKIPLMNSQTQDELMIAYTNARENIPSAFQTQQMVPIKHRILATIIESARADTDNPRYRLW